MFVCWTEKAYLSKKNSEVLQSGCMTNLLDAHRVFWIYRGFTMLWINSTSSQLQLIYNAHLNTLFEQVLYYKTRQTNSSSVL